MCAAKLLTSHLVLLKCFAPFLPELGVRNNRAL